MKEKDIKREEKIVKGKVYFHTWQTALLGAKIRHKMNAKNHLPSIAGKMVDNIKPALLNF